ncbi:methylmalonyl-CoA epimerase [Sporosarcina sp. NCCP-2716]|uniref:methylmalonyl-CoA epimerase n=1 Tax=Sporosarcina sp. NCCP-2716 TaxID=2943679 RepID=UPI00203DF2D6|nr:methylmalonyl-CoA epimerase [Sporosarcina sp. NCCP-2716]GKV68144.1 methylmalonyl-CoA epimerase [Sporosarcina sp. NCCP-2716]
MEKVDHIGIAVKDLQESMDYYIHTLGLKLLGTEEVPEQHVTVAFLDAGNIKLELLEPIGTEGAVSKFISKRGEGVHHIAFGVSDIRQRMADLRENGVTLLQEEPKRGAGGADVAFLHPKSSFGVLVELCAKRTRGDE